MPLSIRDGNSSLTTLSTIVVSSAHIPAHTVVSLGSQAITDIAGAVSGVELGPNTISALENISVTFGAGTSITIGNVVSVTGGLTNAELRASSVTIGGSVSVSNLPSTQTVTFTQASVTFGQASVTFTTPTITGSVSVLNFPATQTVTFTQAPVTFGQAVVSASNINPLLQSVGTDNTADANLQFMKIGGHQDGSNQTSHIVHVSSGGAMKVDASGSSVTFTQASVTFGSTTGSVSVLNFPATQTIAGTVTANVASSSNIGVGYRDAFGNLVNINNIGASLPIAPYSLSGEIAIQDGGGSQANSGIGIGHNSNGEFNIVGENSPLPISGTVTANVLGQHQTNEDQRPIPVDSWQVARADTTVDLIVPVQITNDSGTLNASNPLPISGTVTANNPSGALTTRFGSVTTANLATLTSAVTNTSRKYLLVQNIATSTVTIGIGFAPTTTQGIQLTAGAGLTFDAFCPTGGVWWLSSTTGSNFSILEG